MAGVGRKAMDYRSEQAWGDLPLVHVSVGGRHPDGRYRSDVPAESSPWVMSRLD